MLSKYHDQIRREVAECVVDVQITGSGNESFNFQIDLKDGTVTGVSGPRFYCEVTHGTYAIIREGKRLKYIGEGLPAIFRTVANGYGYEDWIIFDIGDNGKLVGFHTPVLDWAQWVEDE